RKMVAKYGIATVRHCIKENLDRAEARMRLRIAELPDGEYVYEDYLEYFNDGSFDPVLMRLKLTVNGDEIEADFAGSNPQVPGPVNTSLAVAGAGIFVALKSTLDPGSAVNGGTFRPMTFRAPEASIVDVRPNAPAGAHAEVRKRAVSVALGALSQIALDKVSGDLCGTSFPNNIGGYHASRQSEYVFVEVPAGGNGGFLESDGSSAFVNVDHGNIRSIETAENLEMTTPFVVESCALRCDSGGAGKSRGGLGMRRELRLVEDEAEYSVLSDRAVIPPYGMDRGFASAQVGASICTDGQTTSISTPGKASGIHLRKNDIVVMESAGGGGYGDPLKRDPDRVLRDIKFGYVSNDKALELYGVVVAEDGSVDAVATNNKRKSLREAEHRFEICSDDSDPYEGRAGRHRIIKLSQAQAARLSVEYGDLAELRGRHPAPLRCWVKVGRSPSLNDDQIGLDSFGQQVLGISDGDHVVFRSLDAAIKPISS
ncbi:MAG: hydantoinase B/oxoprolinase family protein, partial [Pseudomonadota bacterium]